jgi:hypothetical protein
MPKTRIYLLKYPNPGYTHFKAFMPYFTYGFTSPNKIPQRAKKIIEERYPTSIPSYYLSCKGHSIKGLHTPKSPSLSLYHKYPYNRPPLIGDRIER